MTKGTVLERWRERCQRAVDWGDGLYRGPGHARAASRRGIERALRLTAWCSGSGWVELEALHTLAAALGAHEATTDCRKDRTGRGIRTAIWWLKQEIDAERKGGAS